MLKRRRKGLTLVEMMISLTIAGFTLAMVAAIGARQQQVFADVADRNALSGQMRDAANVLPVDLRAVAPAAGDIRVARDTVLELRATIASAVVCDTTTNTLILAPRLDSVATTTSVVTPIEAGDSIWILTTGAAQVSWTPTRTLAATSAAAGQCAAGGPRLMGPSLSGARTALAIDAPMPPPGTPVRITRPVRYSLYRASDNAWYLGAKDWSNAQAKFNTIQPVAGPFLPPSAGGAIFKFFDGAGMALPSPVADPRAIAAIRIDLRGETRHVVRALGRPGAMQKRIDSSAAMVALRNAR